MLARLQVASAANLHSGDRAVRRAGVFVQSCSNDPRALASWEQLAAEGPLTAEEAEEHARLATLAGSEEQFSRAVIVLEQTGHAAEAATFRSSRLLKRGDLSAAIEEARKAVAASPQPEKKLDLLRLLLVRHAPLLKQRGKVSHESLSAADEIVALADQLQGTSQGQRAAAWVLQAFPLPEDKALEWANSAWKDLSPDNPALLAAADFLIASGKATPDECLAALSPVFVRASRERRMDFARWLNSRHFWDKTLSLIAGQEAVSDAEAFVERGRALAGAGRWEDLLSMSQGASNAPESSRLIIRGLAATKIGKEGIARKSLADAVLAGQREGRLIQTLAALDSLGEGRLADPIIIEECGNPALADTMFRVARDRFGRRGQFPDLSAAFAAAAKASPDAPSVRDFRWRRRLLAGKAVNPDDTAAAVAASPADPQPRFTHALALLQAGRSADALGVFHDIDIFVERLPPGDKAIVIAIWQANGLDGHARSLRQSLHPDLLQSSEYALINSPSAQPAAAD